MKTITLKGKQDIGETLFESYLANNISATVESFNTDVAQLIEMQKQDGFQESLNALLKNKIQNVC